MSTNLKWAVAAVVVIGGGMICVASGLGAYSAYNRYTQALDTDPGFSALRVWIDNPQPGSTFPTKSQILVETAAEGQVPISKMELLSFDGMVLDSLGAPTSEGLSPFEADFHYQPAEGEMGEVALLVRATDAMGETKETLLVFFLVEPGMVDPEMLAEAYVDTGVNAIGGSSGGGGGGAPPGGPPQGSPPPGDGDDPSGEPPPVELLPPGWEDPSGPFTPTLLGFLEYILLNPDAPATPEITASAVEGCKIRLWIADNSDNEDGFRVYRRDPGASDFLQVAVLEENGDDPDEGASFNYEDLDLFGSYNYKISAFNQNGEAFSNLKGAEVTNTNCAPELTNALSFEIVQIVADIPMDMGYCYWALDNANWQRHPTSPNEFLPVNANGGLEGFGELGSLAEGTQATTMDIECWAWSGGDLQHIGTWHYDGLGDTDADDSIIAAPGGDLDIKPVDPNDFVASEYDPGDFESLFDLQVPIPIPWIGHGPQECADYSNIPNPLILGLICGDVADDIDFMLWAIDPNNCPAINSGNQCFAQDDISYYKVWDTRANGGQSPAQTIDAPATLYFLVDETSCDPRHLRVSAVVEQDGTAREGWPSPWIWYPGNPNCPFVLDQVGLNYRITWNTIDFTGNIDDGVDAEDDAEAYGYVMLETARGLKRYWSISEMSHSIAPSIGGFHHAGLFEFEDDADDNPVNWSNIPLSTSNVGPCQIFIGCGAGTGKNKGTFEVFDDDNVYFRVRLWDADPDSADDGLCFDTSGYFAVEDLPLNGQSSTHTLTSSTGSADSCVIKFTIEGLP